MIFRVTLTRNCCQGKIWKTASTFLIKDKLTLRWSRDSVTGRAKVYHAKMNRTEPACWTSWVIINRVIEPLGSLGSYHMSYYQWGDYHVGYYHMSYYQWSDYHVGYYHMGYWASLVIEALGYYQLGLLLDLGHWTNQYPLLNDFHEMLRDKLVFG